MSIDIKEGTDEYYRQEGREWLNTIKRNNPNSSVPKLKNLIKAEVRRIAHNEGLDKNYQETLGWAQRLNEDN